MQSDGNSESTQATNISLKKEDVCVFDLNPEGDKILPAEFGSRACVGIEENFIIFLGK